MAGVRTAETVVEFGPGSGAITRTLLEKLGPEATFFAIELNPDFVAVMKRRFPEVHVYEDSAANVHKYLKDLGRTSCECIVSGLPWAAFGEQLQDELLGATFDALAPGGRFATYTYIHSPRTPAGKRFKQKLEERFALVETSPIVWKNLPPALVYGAKK